ncbi:LysR substrate-binding domain-containing protein [Zongyangia sp. HA2173]|uniref:LysR substrate-binding domain-containing protein n=1 Tax=Zongyangia sp. HA2173 TaxID=3133035 RepID=UPI003169DF69
MKETALTMRHDADLLKARIKHLCDGQVSLSFGATLTVGEFAMPSLLAQYLQNHPTVQIQMQVADTEQLLAKLDRGEIDFAIVEGAFPRNSYECLLFTKERFVPVCGRHYVFQHSVHTIQDLLGERLLVRESGSGTRHILEHYLESYNLSIQDFALQAEISNIAALKNLAAFNCGITFLYQVAAWEELAAGILREIPLENFDIQHDFSFIWRKNSCYGEDYKKVFEEFHRLFVGNTRVNP